MTSVEANLLLLTVTAAGLGLGHPLHQLARLVVSWARHRFGA